MIINDMRGGIIAEIAQSISNVTKNIEDITKLM